MQRCQLALTVVCVWLVVDGTAYVSIIVFYFIPSAKVDNKKCLVDTILAVGISCWHQNWM